MENESRRHADDDRVEQKSVDGVFRPEVHTCTWCPIDSGIKYNLLSMIWHLETQHKRELMRKEMGRVGGFQQEQHQFDFSEKYLQASDRTPSLSNEYKRVMTNDVSGPNGTLTTVSRDGAPETTDLQQQQQQQHVGQNISNFFEVLKVQLHSQLNACNDETRSKLKQLGTQMFNEYDRQKKAVNFLLDQTKDRWLKSQALATAAAVTTNDGLFSEKCLQQPNQGNINTTERGNSKRVIGLSEFMLMEDNDAAAAAATAAKKQRTDAAVRDLEEEVKEVAAGEDSSDEEISYSVLLAALNASSSSSNSKVSNSGAIKSPSSLPPARLFSKLARSSPKFPATAAAATATVEVREFIDTSTRRQQSQQSHQQQQQQQQIEKMREEVRKRDSKRVAKFKSAFGKARKAQAATSFQVPTHAEVIEISDDADDDELLAGTLDVLRKIDEDEARLQYSELTWRNVNKSYTYTGEERMLERHLPKAAYNFLTVAKFVSLCWKLTSYYLNENRLKGKQRMIAVNRIAYYGHRLRHSALKCGYSSFEYIHNTDKKIILKAVDEQHLNNKDGKYCSVYLHVPMKKVGAGDLLKEFRAGYKGGRPAKWAFNYIHQIRDYQLGFLVCSVDSPLSLSIGIQMPSSAARREDFSRTSCRQADSKEQETNRASELMIDVSDY